MREGAHDGRPRPGRVTILQVNDAHGYLEPHPELMWEGREASYPALGGYAAMAGYCRAVRAERPGVVVLLDNGDTFHGTYPVVQSKGEALLPLLNAMRFDAMTAHWDFAYGPGHLKTLVSRLTYPLLPINCFDEGTGTLAFPPSVVVERGGLRIGVIGIAATIVDKTMPPHFSTGLRFTLGNEELPGHISQLRDEGVDLVVVLSHLGFPQDAKLAAEVAGIDVLLSGHTHNRLRAPVWVNGTAIIQSGCHGAFIGRLDLDTTGGRVEVAHHALVPMDGSVPRDPAMQAMVEGIMAPHRGMLRARAGRTSVALNRSTMLEATMDNLLLAAIQEAGGTTIAFSNGWRYGAPVPVGDVTVNDAWNMVPGNPPVSVIELTGQEVLDMMEENLERTFAADPYAQMGGYMKRCAGMTIHAKLENPAGHRIERILIGGGPLRPEATYTASYVTAQGVPARFGRNRRELPVHAVDAVLRYVGGYGTVAPAITGSVVAV